MGVSEETWNNFLEHEVLPRFPDAKSIDAYGQYQWQDGRGIARQYSKILIIDHSDTAENRSKIEEIRNSWKEYSAQESVMKVTFGDKTLQENEGESASKWVETRLTVDLNLPEESLSEEKWRGFVDTIITPRFPDGLSAIVPDGNEASRRGMTAQRSIQVIIDHTDTPENRAKIEEIRSYWKAYSGKEMRKDIYKVKVSF
ncbi:hypothetical protein GCM10010981_13580 [Dyella nitratireducens]|uniref:DUF3574 domain-containing protein n=1 Tax=Dyella nitratireducens TaxID=1849580 RepID=A0ABQ1FRI2_9GAMM|nr:hypothetical protein GCM10010981_13580 [Dyella nitratireducens]GLQ43578.1 hypothetical protein GCM10007902_34280 [Dyella nitratireducens]